MVTGTDGLLESSERSRRVGKAEKENWRIISFISGNLAHRT